jgi:hypothetical protein
MVDAHPKTDEAVMAAASGAAPNGLFYRLARTGSLHLLSFQW